MRPEFLESSVMVVEHEERHGGKKVDGLLKVDEGSTVMILMKDVWLLMMIVRKQSYDV